MKRIMAVFFLLAGLLPAAAQLPQTLPAQSVVGRLGIGSGPGQAIPFATLKTNLGITTATISCNNTSADVATINSAITTASAAGGGVVELSGTCQVGGSSINMANKVYLRGQGAGATVLRLNSVFSGYIINASGNSFIGVSDLTIDAGDFNGGSLSGAINFTNSTDWYMSRIQVVKMGLFGLLYNGAQRFLISDNYVQKTTPDPTNVNGGIFGACSFQNAYGNIIGNRVINTDFAMCDAFTYVAGNYTTGWQMGPGFFQNQDSKCHDNTYVGNTAEAGGGAPDANGYYGAGFELWCPRTYATNNVARANQGAGYDWGSTDGVSVGNIAIDNSQGNPGGSPGFNCRYGTSTYNCARSVFIGNVSYNTNGASGPQKYAYSEESSSISSGSIAGPQLINNNFQTGTSGVLSTQSTSGRYPSFPPGVHVMASPDAAQTWTAQQFFAINNLNLAGSTSGTLAINCAAVCGTNTLTLPAGTTDFSATGGANRVVMQTSAGGALTVAQLAASNLSDTKTGSGSIVLATSPTITSPTINTSMTILGPFGTQISNANALYVGANGTTNPALNVDTTTASSATGINIKSAAAGSGVALSVISSGTNEVLKIDGKGSGNMGLQTVGTGNVCIGGTTGCSEKLSVAVNGNAFFSVLDSSGATVKAQFLASVALGKAAFITTNTSPAVPIAIGTNNDTTNGIVIDGSGNLTIKGYGQTGTVAIGSLPSCTGLAGARYMVNNATQTLTANIGAVVSGTGSNVIPVVCDGTNWRVGANDNWPIDRISA